MSQCLRPDLSLTCTWGGFECPFSRRLLLSAHGHSHSVSIGDRNSQNDLQNLSKPDAANLSRSSCSCGRGTLYSPPAMSISSDKMYTEPAQEAAWTAGSPSATTRTCRFRKAAFSSQNSLIITVCRQDMIVRRRRRRRRVTESQCPASPSRWSASLCLGMKSLSIWHCFLRHTISLYLQASSWSFRDKAGLKQDNSNCQSSGRSWKQRDLKSSSNSRHMKRIKMGECEVQSPVTSSSKVWRNSWQS